MSKNAVISRTASMSTEKYLFAALEDLAESPV
jgi:hypothetical protein